MGFGGFGAFGPQKSNLSDLSHSIKEVEIVKEQISIHLCLAFCPAYLIGKCIGQGKENKSALATLCAEALKRREDKRERERDCKKCAVGTL